MHIKNEEKRLLGAIITTAGFLIYSKTVANNSNQPEMMQMNGNGQMEQLSGNMEQPPEKPDGNNSIEPPTKPEDSNNNKNSDSNITTTKDNSGGIMATGGGILNASNLTVNTAGTSSAAIRTDRGGGTVTVNGGIYTTTGAGSPSIYSTADVTVNDVILIEKASEGIELQKKKLEEEGHTIVQKGRTNIRYYLKDYEKNVFELNNKWKRSLQKCKVLFAIFML